MSLDPDIAHSADEREIVVADPWEFTTLDPTQIGFVYSRMAVGETLVTVSLQSGALVPLLASSWSVDDDGLRRCFRIRDDVRFHDGSSLTPDAVVAA